MSNCDFDSVEINVRTEVSVGAIGLSDLNSFYQKGLSIAGLSSHTVGYINRKSNHSEFTC